MNRMSDKDDCADDLRELDYQVTSQLDRLSRFQKNLSSLRPETHDLLSSMLQETEAAYNVLHTEIQTALSNDSASLELKHQAADKVRTLQGITGSVLVAADWQSPSYLHSTFSEAGTQTGKITGTLNDYKRDHHLDAELYEREFRSEYIDAAFRIPPNVFVTSSGMAAFTTIVSSLHLDGLVSGPVLAGASCYFECKQILEGFFPGNLFFVDEMDVEAIIAAVKELQPAVIFLDTLCNTETIPVPDMKRIIARLSEEITRPTTLVLDNTGLGTMYQPFKDLPLIPGKLHLIVFESLIKYHQFGLDRVTGGIMWSKGISPFGLNGWRMHLGTNMPDASVRSLVQPNRKLLEKRMMRMNRNALFLAHALDHHIKSMRHSPFSHVVYPGLESYTGYAWTQKQVFHGSFFVLACKSRYPQVMVDKMFISLAIAEAAKRGVNLIAGTSFGFDTTRIYLTALHANKTAKPFLRISVGTETLSELTILAEIFKLAIDQISKRMVF